MMTDSTIEPTQAPTNGPAELINVFNYEDKKIRAAGTALEPWFCGNDVAEILGYKSPTDAIRKHVDIDDKTTFKSIYDGAPNHRPENKPSLNELNSTYINESGVYSLVLRSKLPAAKEFKKWITKIVIPSIRKNGYYVSDNISPEKIAQLQAELNEKNKVIEEKDKALDEKDKIIIEEKSKNISYTKRFRYVEELKKTEIFYIATTQQYAKNNRFKYGGVENMNLLRSRLSGYNTGRAEGDIMYFAKIVKCHSYRQIENRLECLAKTFKDKQDSKKEMLEMRYDYLERLVDFIVENNNKEVDYINENATTILEGTLDIHAIVPVALDIGEPKPKKIDISEWTDEQRRDVLIQLLCEFAPDKNNFDYKTTQLVLKWSELIKMIEDKYGKNKRMMWKDSIATLIKNTKIIVDGFKSGKNK